MVWEALIITGIFYKHVFFFYKNWSNIIEVYRLIKFRVKFRVYYFCNNNINEIVISYGVIFSDI